MLLRAAITRQLRDGGPQTAIQVHAALGGEFETVREGMYRLSKSGVLKSERGADRAPSTYRLDDQTAVSKDVAKPFRPVVQHWTLNIKRDPLVCALFGAPGAVATA